MNLKYSYLFLSYKNSKVINNCNFIRIFSINNCNRYLDLLNFLERERELNNIF